MTDRVDYAIVGGGPAGLSVAILAALAGRRAIVIERHPGPVDKACGEGVMPPGVEWLRRMGVEIRAEAAYPFRGIRYVDGDVTATADFVEGPGLGIRRTALSRAMLDRAAALGVDVRHGHAVSLFLEERDHVVVNTSHGPIDARWLVGADGLHSQIRHAAEFKVRPGARRRFGMRRHFRVAPWSDHVEVHWANGGPGSLEAYVTPVGPEHVGVAFLWSAAAASGNYDAFMARFPQIRARLGPTSSSPVTNLLGSGPFELTVESVARGRVLLVGDASGYLDAITGEGLSLAFASAAALVDATAGQNALAYPAAWAALRRRHIALTRVVLWLAEHPSMRRRVIRALGAKPDALRACLALNTGAWGWGRALPAIAALALHARAPQEPRA